MLMDRSDEKVGFVLLDHLFFELLAKLGFPLIAVLFAPRPICLTHLPISANHCVPAAINVATAKFVPEIEWYLFKCFGWRFLKKGILRQCRELRISPVFGRRFDDQPLDFVWPEYPKCRRAALFPFLLNAAHRRTL